MRQHLGEDFYIVWFQEPGVAEAALEPRRATHARDVAVWDAAWAADAEENPPRRPSSPTRISRVYVDAYTRTRLPRRAQLLPEHRPQLGAHGAVAERRITQPALFLTGERDPVRTFMPAAAMDGWVTDLRVNEVIPGAGHWLQQQAPDQVNKYLLSWLDATHDRQ